MQHQWEKIFTSRDQEQAKRLKWAVYINEAQDLSDLGGCILQQVVGDDDNAKRNALIKTLRHLSIVFHPDKFSDPDNTKQLEIREQAKKAFQKIQNLVDTLKDNISTLIPGIHFDMVKTCLNNGKALIHAWARQYGYIQDENTAKQWFDQIVKVDVVKADGVNALDLRGNTFFHETFLWDQPNYPKLIERALNHCQTAHPNLINQQNYDNVQPADVLMNSLIGDWNTQIKAKTVKRADDIPFMYMAFIAEGFYTPMLYGMDPLPAIGRSIQKGNWKGLAPPEILQNMDSVFLCAMVEFIEYKNHMLQQSNQAIPANAMMPVDANIPMSQRGALEQIEANNQLITRLKQQKNGTALLWMSPEQRRKLPLLYKAKSEKLMASCIGICMSTIVFTGFNLAASVKTAFFINLAGSLIIGIRYSYTILSVAATYDLLAYREESSEYVDYIKNRDKDQTKLTIKAALLGAVGGVAIFTVLQGANELALYWNFPDLYSAPSSIEAYFSRGSWFTTLAGIIEADTNNTWLLAPLLTAIAIPVLVYLASEIALYKIYTEQERVGVRGAR
ncbi:MAG: J domain-containing protein [Proteobacteria bacterium]|nr:J domain-containing protein [Pseudomonadota bacterium]